MVRIVRSTVIDDLPTCRFNCPHGRDPDLSILEWSRQRLRSPGVAALNRNTIKRPISPLSNAAAVSKIIG